MPPVGRNETFEDALAKVYTSVAQLALYPDADLEFVTGVQQVIQEKLRATNVEQKAAPATAQPGMDQGMGGDMGGGMPPPGPAGMGGGMPGLSATGGGAPMPNMDELARVLGSQGRVQ